MAQQVASVAVIMRTKDREMLLGRAVADVCAQSWADWHLVIVNDGGVTVSVDEVVRRYESALAGRVTVIHNDVPRAWEPPPTRGSRRVIPPMLLSTTTTTPGIRTFCS